MQDFYNYTDDLIDYVDKDNDFYSKYSDIVQDILHSKYSKYVKIQGTSLTGKPIKGSKIAEMMNSYFDGFFEYYDLEFWVAGDLKVNPKAYYYFWINKNDKTYGVSRLRHKMKEKDILKLNKQVISPRLCEDIVCSGLVEKKKTLNWLDGYKYKILMLLKSGKLVNFIIDLDYYNTSNFK